MNIFDSILNELPGFAELKESLEMGLSPLGVTGVAGIHKAHFISALSGEREKILVITEDEAAAPPHRRFRPPAARKKLQQSPIICREGDL